MISPADSALITEGSEDRRKFMNKIISQYNPVYLDSVLQYTQSSSAEKQASEGFQESGKFDQ